MRKLKIILSSIVLAILTPIIIVSLVILIDSWVHPDEIPSFFGWKPFIVLSGSMETEIYAGDVAVVKKIDTKDIKENDIIAFKDGNIVITHRVIEIINDNGTIKYKTKGDNNNVNDDGYVKEEQIEGLYQFKISKLGDFAVFVQTPIGIVICLSIPLAILLIIQAIESRGNKKRQQEIQEELEYLREQNKKEDNQDDQGE